MKKKVQQTARVLFSFYFLAKEKQLLPHSKALNFCLFLSFVVNLHTQIHFFLSPSTCALCTLQIPNFNWKMMHILFLTIQDKNKKQKLSALHAIYGTFTIEISQNVIWFVISNRTFFRKDHNFFFKTKNRL